MLRLAIGVLGPLLGLVMVWTFVAMARRDPPGASRVSMLLHAVGLGLVGCAAVRFIAGPAFYFDWLLMGGITVMLAGTIVGGWDAWSKFRAKRRSMKWN